MISAILLSTLLFSVTNLAFEGIREGD